MSWTVEVETAPESGSWNDYTSLVLAQSLVVTSQGGVDAGTATAVLRDAAGTAVVLPESGFRVKHDTTVVFRGKVKRRGKTERKTKTRNKWYAITAQDVTCYLVDDIIDTGGARSTAESDAARIIWLVTTFGTKGVTAALPGGGGFVQSLYGSNLPEQDFTGMSLYDAIAEVAKFSGGSFYVDHNLALHFFATESNPAPFNLSDSPNFSTTFPYDGFDFPDDSMDLVNAVYVIGANNEAEWVPAVGTWPTASQSTYGRHESCYRDATLLDSAARQAAGNAILAKYDSPRGPITIKAFRPGLRAGMVIQITNSVWGLSAVSYRIEQVISSVIGTTGVFAYDVTLQDSPVTLQNYLHDTLTTINRDVKRNTNIAVDYAAQFLIGRVKVVNSLPALPDPDYPIGMQVFLTVDKKVYRNPDDVAWTTAVNLPDGIGQITGTQIADDAISTPHILAGSIGATEIAAGAVGTDQLAANSIVAGNIAAGAIGAEALAAQIVLADTLLTTGLTGQRMEMDDAGLRAYSASEQLLVNIPTVGADPVSVVGAVEASSLVSTASAELRGVAELAGGAVMTVQTGVTNPTVAPTLAVSTPSLALASSPPYVGHGLCFDTAGDAGGTTDTYWVGANPTTGNLLDVAYEYNASTGALLRTIRKTGTTQTLTATLGSTSHIADTAEGREGTSESHIATPLTIPGGLVNVKVTKVSAYMAGRNGTCATRVGIWNTSGTLLRESATFTAVDKGATGVGDSVQYNRDLSSPYSIAAGATVWAGFRRTDPSNDSFQWDRDDGSGKVTKSADGATGDGTGWTTWNSASKPNIYLTYTHDVDGSVEGAMTKIVGVARQGSYIWVLDSSGVLYRYNQSDLTYVDKFDLSAYTNPDANAGLFWDGTNLIITTVSGTTGTDQVRFIKVTTGGAYSSTLTATGLAINGSTATVRGGYYDATNYWVSINGVAYAFNASTGANVANRDFGQSSEMLSGLTFDGTYFRGWSSTSNPTKVYQYTGWDWTSESAVYWLCYTWYDITGTPHETAVSPRASVTLGRRRQLTVSNPVIPGGGSEPPDRVRVYMARGASDPGGANYDLQSTDALTVRSFTTYDTGGAANPTSNNFPAGTAAEVRSAATGWSLRGDGTMTAFGGTSFPGSPAAGQVFFRSDLGEWFFYDGTRWRCTSGHVLPLAVQRAVQPLSATTNMYAAWPDPAGGDIYITKVWASTYVNTTNDGTRYWTIAMMGQATLSTQSNSPNAVVIESATVNAVLTASGGWLQADLTPVGTTPGSLFAQPTVAFQHIAT